MTFVHVPTWLGFAALLALALAVLLLYLLRPPPRAVIVPSVILWRRLLDEQDRKNRWLRWLLSLLLSFAIAASLVLALVGFERSRRGNRTLLLVVDNSATMQTRNLTGSSRFEVARTEARRRIEAAAGRLYLADTTGQIAIRRFERAEALQELERLRVHPARSAHFPPLPPGLDLEETDIVLITDGVVSFEDSSLPASATVGEPARLVAETDRREVISVFERAVNVGITAFEVASVPSRHERLEAFLEITNGSDQPAKPRLSVLTSDGSPILNRQLTLDRGETWSGLLDLGAFRLSSGTALLARLELEGDALDLDNQAWAVPPETAPLDILVIGNDPSTLARMLENHPSFTVKAITPAQLESENHPEAVWVLDGWAPSEAPTNPALVIGTAARSWLPRVLGEEGPLSVPAAVAITGASSASIEARGAEVNQPLRDLELEKITLYEAPAEQVVLSDGERPILIRSPRSPDGQSAPWYLLPFLIEESNLSLKEEYPILLAQLIERLGRPEPPIHTHPGTIELPTSVREVRSPSTVLSLLPTPAGPLVELAEPGIYALRHDNGRQERLVVDPHGSATTLVNRSTLEGTQAAGPSVAGLPSLRTGLLLLALFLIAMELFTQLRGLTE